MNNEKTLRDYFAAATLQGIYANPLFNDTDYDHIARTAFRQADEMLRERKSEEPT